MDLHIRTLDQISELTLKLVASPRFASLIARYTRGVLVDHSIDIMCLQESEESEDSLVASAYEAGLFAIVQVIKHLDTLVCRTLNVTTALSSLVAPASRPISTGPFLLQVLEIQVEHVKPSLLRQLGQFVALRHLGLFIPDQDNFLDPVYANVQLVEHAPAWSMPLLHTIW
jgi:hypothetical protein